MENNDRFLELGKFIKSKREKISPTQVGFYYGKRRRTPGLKREEVAQLANVSLTWYTWLEQGRDIKVSEQVLESIGNALLLNETEMLYIFSLSQMTVPKGKSKSKKMNLISNPVQIILDKLEPYPSFASDQYWNVIGWNKIAKRIFGDFDHMNSRERNTIWRMFTFSEYRSLFMDWEMVSQWIVAQYRLSCINFMNDSWYKNFIDDLMKQSDEFKQLWLDHNVTYEDDFRKRMNVESLGMLLFDFTSFDVSTSPNIKIAIHTPANQETMEKLNTL